MQFHKVLLFFLIASFVSHSWAQQNQNTMVIDIPAPVVVDVDLRDIAPAQPWQPGDARKEVPKGFRDPSLVVSPPAPRIDPLFVQQAQFMMRNNERAFDTPEFNFDGSEYSGNEPPDTVGDVGRFYYVQSVNGPNGSLYRFYDKETGELVAGPFVMSALGAGVCGSGYSDPIILYDQLANRWFISEISASSRDLCLYVSRTDDPITGGWYAYSFNFPRLPDYPKYGITETSYTISSNELHGHPPAGIYAVNRLNLLNGVASTMVRTLAPELSGFGFQAVTPADLDGNLPAPTGSPLIYMRHRDDESHGGNTENDYLDIFEYSVDWSDPESATLSEPISIAISDFDSDLCGLSTFSCMDQPGGEGLDSIREVIMHRLTYRNFGTYEVLLGNFVTDVDGTDRAGIRWFELRRSDGVAGQWQLYQEGTVAFNDNYDRYIGSIAMDDSGNIALAYNVSGTTLPPSLRYVGRLANDPPGVMTQGEYSIVEGTSANDGFRYGDYASMSIDSENGCTFWFTGEYNASPDWSTRIASFSFDSCGCEQPAKPGSIQVVAAEESNRVELSWIPSPSAATYRIYRAQADCESFLLPELIASDITGSTYVDETPHGSVVYRYQINAVSLDDCESSDAACFEVVPNGHCLLPPTFSGAISATSADEDGCSIDLEWEAGTPSCSEGQIVYKVYRSEKSGFIPGPENRIADCLTQTTYKDDTVDSGVTYFYIVRAEDLTGTGQGSCGGLTEDNMAEVQAAAFGPPTIVLFDDLESGTGNFTTESLPADTTGNVFQLTPLISSSPQFSYFTRNEARTKDQALILDPHQLSGVSELIFFHRYNLEDPWDGAVLEYSLDSSSFVDILEGQADIPANANRFLENGYVTALNPDTANPLTGRDAWTGDSSGFIRTRVDLSDFVGRTVTFRWRHGSDNISGGDGWYLDDFQITQVTECSFLCSDLQNATASWPDSNILRVVECIIRFTAKQEP